MGNGAMRPVPAQTGEDEEMADQDQRIYEDAPPL